MGTCRMDWHQIWGLVELIFELFFTKMLLSELIFGPNEAS